MNLSLTQEELLTKPQLLEMLHEAWDKIETLLNDNYWAEQQAYRDGYNAGHNDGMDGYYD